MNKFTEMSVLESLIKAEALLKKIGKDGSYTSIFTVEEFVQLDIAVNDAKKLLSNDLLSRVQN